MNGKTGAASANRMNATIANKTRMIGVIHHAFSWTRKYQNSLSRPRLPSGSWGWSSDIGKVYRIQPRMSPAHQKWSRPRTPAVATRFPIQRRASAAAVHAHANDDIRTSGTK